MNTQIENTENYTVVTELEYDRENDRGKVVIKVGNEVGEVKLRSTFEDEVEATLDNNLQSIQNAGVELDLQPIKDTFEAKYEEVQAEKLEEQKEQAREKYQNSWVHDVEAPDTDHELILEIEDEDHFVDRVTGRNSFTRDYSPTFRVKYRDYSVSVSKKDVGRRFNTSIKYQVNDKITDYNRRNYGAPENAVEKIVELIDEEIAEKERKEDMKKERQRKRAKKKERLENQFGDLGEIQIEKKYRRGNYYHEFHLVIDDDTKFSLTENYKKKERYNFESFKELTAAQVRDIIEVLLR